MSIIQSNISIADKYPAYKDSGVEWLGVVPSKWEVLPLFALTKLKSISNCPVLELLSVYLDLGVIRFSDIDAKRTNATSLDLSKYQKVEPGDFVLNNQQAWRGSVGVSNYEGIVSPAYIILSLSHKLNPSFANYYFRNGAMVSQYLISSKGVGTIQRNLYWPQLRRTYVGIPPIEEQTAIALFLDDKTTKIDRVIAQKQQMIALLKERKQIIIQNAVTKGLNYDSYDDFDCSDAPNNNHSPSSNHKKSKFRRMKDSGVEWIGEIPEEWEVKALRFIGSTQNGISAGAEYFGEGFPFVSYGDVYKNIELPKYVNGLAKSTDDDRKNYSVREGDVFFTRTSETIEEIGFSSTCLKTIENATFAGFLIRFRPNPKFLDPAFSKFYFSSKVHRAYFVKEMNLVIRASLSQELLKKLPVLLPPIVEQRIITTHIEAQSIKIDQAIQLQAQQIEKLKELKATLIDGAVTGKIRVSEL